MTNPDIAAALFLSRPTVATHLRGVFNKTGAANRVAASRWFSESGIDP